MPLPIILACLPGSIRCLSLQVTQAPGHLWGPTAGPGVVTGATALENSSYGLGWIWGEVWRAAPDTPTLGLKKPELHVVPQATGAGQPAAGGGGAEQPRQANF